MSFMCPYRKEKRNYFVTYLNVTYFNLLDYRLLLKGSLVLDFCMIAISPNALQRDD